jgi:hypothetical protein
METNPEKEPHGGSFSQKTISSNFVITPHGSGVRKRRYHEVFADGNAEPHSARRCFFVVSPAT